MGIAIVVFLLGSRFAAWWSRFQGRSTPPTREPVIQEPTNPPQHSEPIVTKTGLPEGVTQEQVDDVIKVLKWSYNEFLDPQQAAFLDQNPLAPRLGLRRFETICSKTKDDLKIYSECKPVFDKVCS